jgi:RNA polymerase sigma-70 factor, ECF subfamily
MIRDEELARQLQDGNEAAMEALVHRHHRSLYAYLYRLTGDAATADDLAQECLIRVCTRISSYRFPEPFLPWLFAIAQNLCRDWQKSAYHRRVVPGEPPEQPGPVDLLDRFAARAEVASALQALAPAHRSTLVLRYYHDLTVDQIARVEGIPAGTVKSRLSDAIKRLRTYLTAERRAGHGND